MISGLAPSLFIGLPFTNHRLHGFRLEQGAMGFTVSSLLGVRSSVSPAVLEVVPPLRAAAAAAKMVDSKNPHPIPAATSKDSGT